MDPKVIIRLGSHAEKEYLLKTLRFFDGLIIGANLIEATPAATGSLIVKASGEKQAIPYHVDPMTYAFGEYTDPKSHEVRTDLDWIKSNQKDRKTKKEVRRFKRSYLQLASDFGGLFEEAISRGKAIRPIDLSSPRKLDETSSSVVGYQLNRITKVFEKDPEYSDYVSELPPPSVVFAPYFYVEPSDSKEWTRVNLKLASAAAGIETSVPVHAILCVDHSHLGDKQFIEEIESELPRTGVSGVWLWFSRFREETASKNQLRAFRDLVESLSSQLEVFNLHGGFLSLALSRVGLAGTSHGIGYGEQKDVVPVIGQSTPTVRYYHPHLFKRISVPDLERCFDELGISSPAEFHKYVCSCVVCRGVISESLSEFSVFGEMHRSSPMAKRLAQTPAAAKRCRFHFLLNRIRERDELHKLSLSEVQCLIMNGMKMWGNQPSLAEDSKHLERWLDVLS